MVSKTNWKAWIIVGAALALFVVSGGVLMASNMGFKINTSLQNGFVAPGPKGDNWRSLPWVSPNTTYTALCTTFGNAGATKSNISLLTVNAATGVTTTVNCAVGNAALIPVGGGIRVRVTGAVAPASPANIVLVGSSNETAAFPTIQGGFVAPGPKGDNWIAPPYHTTWTKASDVCTTFGLTVAGSGNLTRIEPTTGVATTFTCGLAANNFNLIIGEAVRLRKIAAGNVVGTLPPHF